MNKDFPRLERAFTEAPSYLSTEIERTFKRGEAEMKRRHKLVVALTAVAACAILMAGLAFATGQLTKPKPDRVATGQGGHGAPEADENTLPEITPEPTPTPEVTPIPTATPEVTPEPTPTPEVTPEPTPMSTPETEVNLVYTQPKGNYYHSDPNCAGMVGAVPWTEESAISVGKQPCPVCILGTATLEEAPEEADPAETVEVNVDQAFEAAAEAAMDLPVEEAAPTAEAAPVGDAAVVVDDAAAVESQKGAANGPTSVAIDASQGNEFYLGMGPIQLTAVLQPPEAQTTLKWKSSKKKVAKVNAAGVLTPRKAGTSKITVTTGNKKKSSIKVTIRKNIIDNINPKPTRALFNELGRNFVFYPKSVERTAGGKYVCKFYLVNGVGSSRSVNNIGLKLYVGDTLIGQKTVKRVKVRCAKGRSKVFKITFGPQDLLVADPMLLPQYGAEKILFQLTTNPSMTYVVRR